MTKQHEIWEAYHVKGESVSAIAEGFGLDRKTVRKYLDKDDWNNPPPKMVSPEAVDFPKLEPYKATIDQWLMDDRKAPRKQRHTAKRIYDRLMEGDGTKQGFNCSYRTVAQYVRKRRDEILGAHKDPAIPLVHRPGEAQADFGSAQYVEGGITHEGKYFNLSFPSSNQGFFQLFPGERKTPNACLKGWVVSSGT